MGSAVGPDGTRFNSPQQHSTRTIATAKLIATLPNQTHFAATSVEKSQPDTETGPIQTLSSQIFVFPFQITPRGGKKERFELSGAVFLLKTPYFSPAAQMLTCQGIVGIGRQALSADISNL